MSTLDTLITRIITMARASSMKLVAIELEGLVAREDMAPFIRAYFAGSVREAGVRREIDRECEALAKYALDKAMESFDAGRVEQGNARAGISMALGHLRAVVENGNRFGRFGDGDTNDNRAARRRDHLRRAFAALDGIYGG